MLRIAACALFLVAGGVQAHINVRVSVKFILDSSGQLPSNGGGFGASGVDLVSQQAVEDNIDFINDLLDANGRGYRFQLTEVVNVSGWSSFYNLAARNGSNKAALEAVATSNATTRAQFAWRNNAINVYINNTSSGWCSFPGSGNVIFIGSRAYDTLIVHEIGHYFSLPHTHSGEQYLNSNGTACTAANCSCAQLIGGNSDGFADTLADHQCWSRAQMVANNPGATTAQVDDTFLNIMSYHNPQDHFTRDQWDAWVDTANGARSGVVSGTAWWVNQNNVCLFPNGSRTCVISGGPFTTVLSGINQASSSDIVLVRGGNYNETFTTSSPAEVRSTRGDVFIGRP